MTADAGLPPLRRPPAPDHRPPSDRRRPGRRAYVSPGLLHVLRSPHQADPEAEDPSVPLKE